MKVEILGKFEKRKDIRLPLYNAGVSAGFPSPADDFIDKKLDLNEHLILHPEATFFVRVEGDSMINAGINSGDILIVDRALEPKHKKIVIAILDGDFTVKRMLIEDDNIILMPENPDYSPTIIKKTTGLEVWGVVSFVIHQV